MFNKVFKTVAVITAVLVSSLTATPALAATAPSAPTSLGGSASGNSIGLYWSYPTSEGGKPVTDFIIQYKRSTTSTWTTAKDGVNTSTEYKITGLSLNTSYNVRVAAKNAVGTGAYTAAKTIATKSGLAGAPTWLELNHIAAYGVAVDASGNAYYSEPIQQAIFKVTPAGDITRIAGNGASGYTEGVGSAASFDYPMGMTVDNVNNKLYVADSYNSAIRVIDLAKNTVSTFVGTGYGTPTQLVLSADARTLYADVSDAVVKYDVTTKERTIIFENADNHNNWSNGLALNADGTILYSSMAYNGISAYNIAGKTETKFKTGTFRGLAQRNGILYTTDTNGYYSKINIATKAVTKTSTYLYSNQFAMNTAGTVLYGIDNYSPVKITVSTSVKAALVKSSATDWVTFTFAVNDGSAPATDFVVQYRVTGTSAWTTVNDGVNLNEFAYITGITNGKTYDVRVAVKNSYGIGAWSTLAGKKL